MKCELDYCDKDAQVSGLCRGHYNQKWQGRPFKPLRSFQKSDVGVPGWRRCNWCGAMKKVSEFYLRTNGNSYQSKCKPCLSLQNSVINARRNHGEDSTLYEYTYRRYLDARNGAVEGLA